MQILQECGIEKYEVAINSVATPEIRARHRVELLKYIEPRAADLPAVDREKITRNPLRLFDSKEKSTREIMLDAPLLSKFYDDAVNRDFEIVMAALEKLGVPFVVDPRLVRGLDYYTRTAFEVRSSLLGAQDALSGGGRYDLLVAELGGDPTPAVGFAAGMERTLLAMEATGFKGLEASLLDLFIVAVNEDERREALTLAGRLREAGISVDLDFLGRSQKAQMKEAARQRARFAILVFSDDLATQQYTIKNLASGEQERLPYAGLMRVIVSV